MSGWLGLDVKHADYASEERVKFIEDDARGVHSSRHEDLSQGITALAATAVALLTIFSQSRGAFSCVGMRDSHRGLVSRARITVVGGHEGGLGDADTFHSWTD